MARLLVIGLGPLLVPGTQYLGGQCLRTWQFARPLIEERHLVDLVTCPADATLPERGASRVGDGVEELDYEGFRYTSFRHRDVEAQLWYLRERMRRQRYDGIVAVNTYAGELIYHLGTRLPAWCDLNGWGMAESQAKAARRGDDAELRASWRQEKAVALRGDRFSTVSQAQRHALFGELASLGRLNAANAATHLVAAIPNAAAPLHSAVGARRVAAGGPLAPPEDDEAPPIPSGAPLVLCAGGFNYWTDPAALLAAMERGLASCPEAHVVVTGGPIKGYGEEIYDDFAAAYGRSAHRERIHLLGWLPTESMLDWFAAATVGLNFDLPSLEAEFGARNRLTNMAASALAAVTTRGTEVAADLERRGAGWFVAPGDAEALGDALAGALGDSPEAWRRGCAAAETAAELYADAATVGPLLEWAEQPVHAPDNAEKLAAAPDDPAAWVFRPANELQERETLHLWEDAAKLRVESASLRNLREKLPMRLWRRLRRRRD